MKFKALLDRWKKDAAPLYEDIGLTSRFVELTREFKKSLTVGIPDRNS